MGVGKFIIGGVLLAGAASVAEGISTDGYGNVNLDLQGFVQVGECAKLLDSADVSLPVPDQLILERIKALGRLCGFCMSSTELTTQGASHKVCVDPESIILQHPAQDPSQPSQTIQVLGFMKTIPDSAPGYLFNAFDSNPAICSQAITEIRDEMVDYIGQGFDAQSAPVLVPEVYISPTSNQQCESAQNTAVQTITTTPIN